MMMNSPHSAWNEIHADSKDLLKDPKDIFVQVEDHIYARNRRQEQPCHDQLCAEYLSISRRRYCDCHVQR